MIPSESSSSSANATSGNKIGPVGFGNVTFGSNPASAVSVGGASVSYLVLGIVAAVLFFFWRKN